MADGRVIGMGTALGIDPTLREVADLPPGWRGERDRVGGPWRRQPAPELDVDDASET